MGERDDAEFGEGGVIGAAVESEGRKHRGAVGRSQEGEHDEVARRDVFHHDDGTREEAVKFGEAAVVAWFEPNDIAWGESGEFG